MTTSRLLLALLVGSVLGAAVARAESPCLADIRKHCADTPASGGKIQACLKAHESDLSASCTKILDELKRETRPLAAPCRYDIARLCADVAHGGGRIANCLKTHADDLSPECKERLGKAPGQ
ncbi:MAG: cysteine rich repeat-containing protein [Candidatus Binatia bacterium]